MNQTTTKQTTDELAALPPRRHRWGFEKRLAHTEFADGNARTEKMCCHCHLVKITVHPPGGSFPWNEWRTESGEFWKGGPTPACHGPSKRGNDVSL
jgi:hypothetical protein